MLKKFLFAVVSCLALSPAFAALTFTLTETGGNVVVTASGSVNTAALTPMGVGVCGVAGDIVASNAGFCGGAGVLVGYIGMTGPTSFGPGGATAGNSTSGDAVGVQGVTGEVFLPGGYLSGSILSGTTTFAGATFASLGVTPGTYTWTFGAGAAADSVVVTTGAVVSNVHNVPTLGQWALVLLAGLLGWMSLGALRRRAA